MKEPTLTSRSYDSSGDFLYEEFEAKHSVTLTQSAKSEWRVSEVKAYHNDPLRAAEEAVKMAVHANADLKKHLGGE